MKDDVVIEIFGEIRTVEAFREILEAAENEGMTDWNDNEVSHFEVFETATDDSGVAMFMRQDTQNHFDALTAACQAHDVSYKMVIGPSGGEGYTLMKAWKPGFENETSVEIDGADDPVVTLNQLKVAYTNGLEGVSELIDTLETRSLSNTPRALVISPELLEEFHAGEAPSP